MVYIVDFKSENLQKEVWFKSNNYKVLFRSFECQKLGGGGSTFFPFRFVSWIYFFQMVLKITTKMYL